MPRAKNARGRVLGALPRIPARGDNRAGQVQGEAAAKLCRAAGGELEQIQFLLGHISVQTTERYLGCTQRISSAVNDRIGIGPLLRGE